MSGADLMLDREQLLARVRLQASWKQALADHWLASLFRVFASF